MRDTRFADSHNNVDPVSEADKVIEEDFVLSWARRRLCCSVCNTAPVLVLLLEILQNQQLLLGDFLHDKLKAKVSRWRKVALQ